VARAVEHARSRQSLRVSLRSEKLPITPGTGHEPARLAELYQSALDWDDPMGPSPWTHEQQKSFRREADAVLAVLRRELGTGWTVEDQRS